MKIANNSNQQPSAPDITASDAFKRNQAKREARHLQDITYAAEGTRINNYDDGIATYGFHDLKVWVPSRQTWVLLTKCDQDKFIVISDDPSTAASEFWARWRIFCNNAFRVNYIKINATN